MLMQQKHFVLLHDLLRLGSLLKSPAQGRVCFCSHVAWKQGGIAPYLSSPPKKKEKEPT